MRRALRVVRPRISRQSVQTQTLHRQPTHVGATALVYGIFTRRVPKQRVHRRRPAPHTRPTPHRSLRAHVHLQHHLPNTTLRLHRTRLHTQEKRRQGHEREFADQRRTRRCSSFEELKHGGAKIDSSKHSPAPLWRRRKRASATGLSAPHNASTMPGRTRKDSNAKEQSTALLPRAEMEI